MKPKKQKEKLPEQKNLFKVAVSDFKKSEITKKLFGAIVFIVSITAPMFITNKQPYLWSGFIVLCLMIIYFGYTYAKLHNFKTFNTIVITIIGIIIIGGLKYGLNYTQHKIAPCDYAETLYEYFNCASDTEWQYRLRTEGYTTYTNHKLDKNIKVKYDSHLALDFKSLTYFIEFYCHDEVLMLWFAEIAPTLVDSTINKNLYIENAIPNTMRDKAKTLNDLTFTKIVYLYLDKYINATQEKVIKESFEKHIPPYKLVLRTRLYALNRNNNVEITPE